MQHHFHKINHFFEKNAGSKKVLELLHRTFGNEVRQHKRLYYINIGNEVRQHKRLSSEFNKTTLTKQNSLQNVFPKHFISILLAKTHLELRENFCTHITRLITLRMLHTCGKKLTL